MTSLSGVLRMLYARARHVGETGINTLEREEMPLYSHARTTFSTFYPPPDGPSHQVGRPGGELTREARDSVKTVRDTKITELADQGKSQREIAAEVGVSQQTVMRAADPKRNTSEMDHPNQVEGEPGEAVTTKQPEQKEPPKSRGVGVKSARVVSNH